MMVLVGKGKFFRCWSPNHGVGC